MSGNYAVETFIGKLLFRDISSNYGVERCIGEILLMH